MSYVLFHGHSHGGEHDTPSGPMKMVSQIESKSVPQTGTSCSQRGVSKHSFRPLLSTLHIIPGNIHNDAIRKSLY